MVLYKRGCVNGTGKFTFGDYCQCHHLELCMRVGISSLRLSVSASSRLSRSSKLQSSLITDELMASSTLVQIKEMGSMSSQKNLCSGGMNSLFARLELKKIINRYALSFIFQKMKKWFPP